MEAVIDNDILFKAASYDLFDELLSTVISTVSETGVLGAAKYVALHAIGSSDLDGNVQDVIDRLNAFIDRCETIEPTEPEQNLAADFELAAQRAGFALDAGESQLCSVVIYRSIHLLCTGDKRAIEAMEKLLTLDSRLDPICGKVLCLEQIVKRTLEGIGLNPLRDSICRERGVDRTLTICFSCSSSDTDIENVTAGLTSYVNDLRKKAPRMLAV